MKWKTTAGKMSSFERTFELWETLVRGDTDSRNLGVTRQIVALYKRKGRAT